MVATHKPFVQAYYRDEEERLNVLNECRRDLYMLGKVILGYKDAEPEPHRRMCEFISRPGKKKMIVGTRGIYKTSFCTIARAIQHLLIDPNRRILIVMNTLINARKKVSEILGHLNSNEKLRQLVPDYIPVKRGANWSSSAIQINRPGIFPEPSITAAGVDSQVASGHYDVIMFDDPVAAGRDDMKEEGVIIIKPEEVDKAIGLYKIVEGLCINTPDAAKRTEITIMVNRWAVQDFAAYVMDHDLQSTYRPHGFEFLQLAAHKEDGSLLWKRGMNETKLKEIRDTQGEFMYWTQYECRPYNPSDRGFPPETLDRMGAWWEGDSPKGAENMNIYALMDLADAKHAANCKTAMVVLWVDHNRHIWVGEAVSAKLDPLAKIDLIHEMVKRYNLKTVHIEENLHNNMLKFSLRQEMERRGEYYRVEPLKHKNRDKDSRILKLQPHYERGAIHLKRSHTSLLQEMRDFPFTHYKDTIDALAYIMDIVRKPPAKVYEIDGAYYTPNVITGREILADIKRERKELFWGRGPYSNQYHRVKDIA